MSSKKIKKPKQKVLFDGTFILVSDIVIKMKGLIFLPFIIDQIGLFQYGILVQVLMSPGIIAGIFSISLGSNLVRFTSKLDSGDRYGINRDVTTVFSGSIGLAIVGSLLLYILSGPINMSLFQGTSQALIKASCLLVLTEVMWRILGFYLKSRKKFKTFSVSNMIYQFVPYMGIVLGIYFTKNLLYSIVYMAISQFLIICAIRYLCLQELRFVRPSWSRLKYFVSYSWPLSLSNISGGLLAKSDRYLISYFLGPSATGIYSVLYMILSFIDQLSNPFRTYLSSHLPRMWDNNDKESASIDLRTGSFYYSAVAFLLILLSITYLDDFLRVVLNNDDFSEIDNFQGIVISIGLGICFLGLNRFNYLVMQLMKKTRVQLLFQLMGLLISVILNLLLIPILGLYGAGIATLIAYFSTFIGATIFIKERRIFPEFWQVIVLLVAVLGYLLTATIVKRCIDGLALSTTLSLITYCLIVLSSLYVKRS